MRTFKVVMLIDDNEHDNYIHSFNIKKVDSTINVILITSGIEALEYFTHAENDPANYPLPDLVFLDINMPKMNGFEFMEKARERDLFVKNNTVLVVMLTSSLNPSDALKAKEMFKSEIIEFKNKPLTPDMYREIIAAFSDYTSN